MVDEEGKSRGFGFVSFDCFESADAAIEGMDSQFISNKQIHPSYAYKKDTTNGEKHGSDAERLLAKKISVTSIRPRPFMSLASGGFPIGGMQSVGMGRPQMPDMNIVNMGQNVYTNLGRGLPPVPPRPSPGLPQQFRPLVPSVNGRFPFPPMPFGQVPPVPLGMHPGMSPVRPPNFPPPWMQIRPHIMGGSPSFVPPFRPPPLPTMPPPFFPPGMPSQKSQQQQGQQ